MKVVGIRKMNGTSKKTGKPYNGIMVHYLYQEEGTDGYAADSEFLDTDRLYVPPIAPGGEITINHDKRGFVTSVQATAPSAE